MDLTIPSLFRVEGKYAFVTGGSSGVGRMIAASLAANGARVTISGRNEDRLASAADTLGCDWIAADLSQADEIDRLAVSRREPVDILVNNAGTTWAASLADFPAEGFDKVLALNMRAPFLLAQKLLPHLKARATAEDYSRIVNISSVGARMIAADGGSIAYGPSKAAIEQMTRIMARQLGKHRITANAIAPGWFPSRMNVPLGEAAALDWIANTPLDRLGTARDIGGLVLFLCSPAGLYVNGQVIACDGGRSL